jgi:hypothetical protein
MTDTKMATNRLPRMKAEVILLHDPVELDDIKKTAAIRKTMDILSILTWRELARRP